MLGSTHIDRSAGPVPGLATPRDVSPCRHGHPSDAERDARQDVADEMDAQHDPRERDSGDDQGGRDNGRDAAAARQEAESDQQAQTAAD